MALIDQKTDLKRLKYADFSNSAAGATGVGPAVQVSIGSTIKGDTPTYNRFSKPILARKDDLLRMARLLTYNGAANRDIKEEINALSDDIESTRRNTSLTQAQKNEEILRIKDRQATLRNVTNGLKPAAQNFLANQAIISTAKTINAVQKAKRNATEGKQSFKQVAGAVGSEIASTAGDAVKIIGGLLAQTPVAGTGLHFIYTPAIGNQYLNTSGGLLGKEGIDGARAAYDGATIIADSVPTKGDKGKVTYGSYSAGENSNAKILEAYSLSNLRAGLDVLDEGSNRATGPFTGDSNQIFREKYTRYSSLGTSIKSNSDGTVKYENSITEEDNIVREKDTLLKNKNSTLNQLTKDQEKSFIKEVNGKFDKNFTQTKYTDDSTPIRVMTNRGNFSPFKVGGSTGDQRNLVFEPTVKLTDDLADIIPFEFQLLIPGRDPQYVYFRAYLDSFNDNFSSEWAGTKYIGRADELYTYNGFSREISFDFKIAAMSEQELTPLYEKLNFFVGSTAPSYNDDNTFMRGVFSRVTIGDYLQSVPGFFKSISLSWDKSYPWEIGFNAAGEENGAPRNPTVLNVSTTYQPVHDFNPAINQSFIGATVG